MSIPDQNPNYPGNDGQPEGGNRAPNYPPAGPPQYPGNPVGYPDGIQPEYPPNGAWGQPNPGYYFNSAIPENEVSSITLDVWFSVFFGWIPALIFYAQRNGSTPLTQKVYRNVLGFWLTNVFLLLGSAIAGGIIALLALAAGNERFAFAMVIIIYIALILIGLVYFIVGIVGAAITPGKARAGIAYRYPLTIGWN